MEPITVVALCICNLCKAEFRSDEYANAQLEALACFEKGVPQAKFSIDTRISKLRFNLTVLDVTATVHEFLLEKRTHRPLYALKPVEGEEGSFPFGSFLLFREEDLEPKESVA